MNESNELEEKKIMILASGTRTPIDGAAMQIDREKVKSPESDMEKWERKELARTRRHGSVFVRPVVCGKCGHGGGTLVKAGEKYQHQGKCPKI